MEFTVSLSTTYGLLLDEIQSELNVLKDELNIEAEIHITMAAEAKQWRMSEAKRQHLERSYEG